MSSPLYDPRWAQLLRRAFALKGNFVLSAEDGVLPTWQLADASQPEWAAERGEQSLHCLLSQAAVAAELSAVMLYNPPASGMLVVVEQEMLLVDAGSQAVISAFYTLPAAAGADQDTHRNRDTRTPVVQRGACEQRLAHSASLAQLPEQVGFEVVNGGAALASFPLSLPFVLAPGTGLGVVGLVVNKSVGAAFAWRERPIGEEAS